MGDPLSVAASVAALAGVVFQSVQLVKGMKTGGNQRREIASEVKGLLVVLRSTEAHFEAAVNENERAGWVEGLRILCDDSGIFEQASVALQKLNSILQPQRGAKRILQSLQWPIMDKSEVDSILQSLVRLRQSMSSILLQANNALEQEISSVAREINDDTHALRGTIDSQDMENLLEWLSPSQHLEKYANLLKQAGEGTGTWFLESDALEAWRTAQNSTLWCPGIPGAGKTYMMSICAQSLKEKTNGHSCLVLVAYCSYNDIQTQSLEALLSGLLKESIQITGTFDQDMRDSFRLHSRKKTRPTCTDLLTYFRRTIAPVEQLYILLDALDEVLKDKDRVEILRNLWVLESNVNLLVTSRDLPDIRQHFGLSNNVECQNCHTPNLSGYFYYLGDPKLKVCMDCDAAEPSSSTVADRRFSASCIDIEADDKDLRSYVTMRVGQSLSLESITTKNPGLYQEIVDNVIRLARGRFLLARFHMDTLAALHRPSRLKQALIDLPSKIDQSYDQAMQRILGMGQNVDEAKNFLAWVVCAYRPLSIREIEHATATFADQKEIDPDDVIGADVLCSWCAGLVTIDAGYVKLVHYTAETYFQKSKERWFPTAKKDLPQICLTYLMFNAFLQGSCGGESQSSAVEHRVHEYPLLEYASVYWGSHLRDNCRIDFHAKTMEFLLSKPHRETAVQMLWYAVSPDTVTWEAQSHASALHLPSFFGLDDVVSSLLDLGHDTELEDSVGATPLMYASSQGHHDVVVRLSQAGSKINARCNHGTASIHRAVIHNRVKVVEVLLKYDELDVNVRDTSRFDFTPLLLAIKEGHFDVLEQILTRRDAALVTEEKVAFVWAAHLGQLEAVKLMLQDERVGLDVPDRFQRTALLTAAGLGHVEIVRILLTAGADPEKQDNFGGTPILRAIDCNRLAVVNVLIEHGVQLNTVDNYSRTLIHGAALGNKEVLLRLLLDQPTRIDINAQGHDGRTALHDAAYQSHIQATKLLLEHGARTDLRDNSGRTPLEAAQRCYHHTVSNILYSATISRPNTSDDQEKRVGQTPLWLEAKMGTGESISKAIKLRQSHTDFDIDERHPDPVSGLTALDFATEKGDISMMKALLASGARVNHINSYKTNALFLAVDNRQAAAVDLLLAHGADASGKDLFGSEIVAIAENNMDWKSAVALVQYGATAPTNINGVPRTGFMHETLCTAAAAGNTQAVRNLIRAGAETQKRDGSGMTPFHLAKQAGHEETARILLEVQSSPLKSSDPALTLRQ